MLGWAFWDPMRPPRKLRIRIARSWIWWQTFTAATWTTNQLTLLGTKTKHLLSLYLLYRYCINLFLGFTTWDLLLRLLTRLKFTIHEKTWWSHITSSWSNVQKYGWLTSRSSLLIRWIWGQQGGGWEILLGNLSSDNGGVCWWKKAPFCGRTGSTQPIASSLYTNGWNLIQDSGLCLFFFWGGSNQDMWDVLQECLTKVVAKVCSVQGTANPWMAFFLA